MELHWFWQTVLIFFIGTFILRIGGRKSISQMTISQTVVMIGLGSLLVQPITGRGLWITFTAALILSLLMVITEFLQIKMDFVEKLFTGKARLVIENGVPNIENMKKLRLSMDRLETRLRQVGVSSIEDVKYASLEVSGQLGYELMENKKPVTKDDLFEILLELNVKGMINLNSNFQENKQENNLFKEIITNKYEGNKNEP